MSRRDKDRAWYNAYRKRVEEAWEAGRDERFRAEIRELMRAELEEENLPSLIGEHPADVLIKTLRGLAEEYGTLDDSRSEHTS